jgi:hypothetical protein
MQIDRSNYEIWFIDWLDGNLNSQQVEQLMLFLNENPDLMEEFNDLPVVRLLPYGSSFPNKIKLRKLASDISPVQFEYLCAAYLENDLTDSQKTELIDIADQNPGNKKTFDLIQLTRLTPENIHYEHKNLLLRLTAFQKALRFSVIGLSSAAAIALIIITLSKLPVNQSPDYNPATQNIGVNNTLPESLITNPSNKSLINNKLIPPKQQRTAGAYSIQKEKPAIAITGKPIVLTNDSTVRIIDHQDITVIKVPVNSRVDLKEEIISNTLVASNITFNIPADINERSKVGRFISKTFREKILKEKTPSDRPLKGYEIAEAGVFGLNKLLGWEMALDKSNDPDGELSSISFSSKILKFNAPVKKSEPLQ